jgi:hypothetical protein
MGHWFTVEIQASNTDGTIWQALAPAENVDGDTWGHTSAAHIGQMVADHRTLGEREGWRVCVWNGADADAGTEPAYIWDVDQPRRFTAWLTTDPSCLDTDFADVLVFRDELRSDDPELWESVGAALVVLRTSVDVSKDGINIHAYAQAEAEELLAENGWRAEDDWRWEAYESGYMLSVELANA